MLSTTQNRAQEPAAKPLWQTSEWLEPRLVVLTGAALAMSMLGEALGLHPLVILVLNLIAYVAGGFFGTIGAIRLLIKERKVDVDLLMVLAAVGAALIDQWHEGAMLLFLFSLSNVLQDYAIGRSRQAIKSLMKLYPQDARVRRGSAVETVTIQEIRVGEVVLIQPGERIPVDGLVIAGRSTVDQAPITGESLPVEKEEGSQVFAGTLNGQGALDVRAAGEASDTTLARIIKMVEEAQDSKAPTERFLEAFEERYAVFILVSITLLILIPPALGWVDFQTNFYRAMVLMTVASPCALVISTPASFIAAIASAARSGVLFKGGAYLEQLATIKAITFDKTGTLTRGKPTVTDVVSCCEISDDDLLRLAASVEARSEHPLAKAILHAAETRSLPLDEISEFEAIAGVGVTALVGGQRVTIGSPAYLRKEHPLPAKLADAISKAEREGKSIMLAWREYTAQPAGDWGLREDDKLCHNCAVCDEQGGEWLGMVAMADQLRPEAKEAVAHLQRSGVEVAMLTGDNEQTARTIAAQVGVRRIHAGLLPGDKVTVVQQLQKEVGSVAMVGDGVNDAPALATADIGIAMGAAGTDVALETADLVLMGDKLELIAYAIDLSKKARRVVWQNIAFSLLVIGVLIVSTFLIALPLPLGVLGHEGSTVIVVLNGLITLLILPEFQRRRQQALLR